MTELLTGRCGNSHLNSHAPPGLARAGRPVNHARGPGAAEDPRARLLINKGRGRAGSGRAIPRSGVLGLGPSIPQRRGRNIGRSGATTHDDATCREIFRAPRGWVERGYPTLTYFNEAAKGGHFAAWEQPELFATEIRAAFRSLRPWRIRG